MAQGINKQVIQVGGDGGGITSVVAGANISVDNTDPTSPIVSSLADRYKTTSTTSQSIVSTGSLTFTVGPNLAYTTQQDVIIAYDANNHMHGIVTSYSGTTLIVDIQHKTGSGTYASWTINLDAIEATPVTVTDSSTINLSITSQDITAEVINGSIDETKLSASVNTSLDLADTSVQPAGLTNYFNKSIDDTDDITVGATNKFATAGEKTKLAFISVTQAVDLDQIESDTATNNAKVSNATHTGDVTGATALTIANDVVTNAKLSNMASAKIKGRVTAGAGDPEDLTASQVKTILAITNTDVSGLGTLATQNGTFSGTHSGTSSGTNTGDQTSIVGITGTKAQFNTAVTDGDFMYVGDAPTAHTHTLANVTDVTMTVENLNSLDDGVDSTLHFHNTDRDRANHTGTQTASTISDLNESIQDMLSTFIVQGANMTITYDDVANTMTFASTGGGGTPNEITLIKNDAPTIPSADNVKLFGREIAGRMLPAFIGPSGLDSALQPLLARNKIGYWCPPGNATTVPGVLGFTAPTVTGFTATARNVATTNMFTRIRRLGYVTAATAGAVGQWRIAVAQFTVGSSSTNLGGFTYIVRFGISDAATVSDARMFMGMRNVVTPTNVEPSTITQGIGIGHGASDANMKIFYGGSAAQTPIDLGANFPKNTLSVDVYELCLVSLPNSSDVHWEVTRVNTGHKATGTIINSGATVLPTNTTLIGPWGYRTNNASALAVGLDVFSAYIETDQ